MTSLIKDLDILTEVQTLVPEFKTTPEENVPGSRKIYIETYGCQMNYSDSEIVMAVMQQNGYSSTSNIESADLILLNTCSIRDNAEQKVRSRLMHLKGFKRRNKNLKIGILGCMAERLKSKLIDEEKMVDLVVGPDAYRDLPNLLNEVDEGQKAINVFLSREETYADIEPVRLNSNGISAFISIMRGCDNMCSFCVVPYTRGRERSRDAHSIINEAEDMFRKGYKEVTLLGQNVDSYKWSSDNETEKVNFAELLEKVALINPDLRVRFSTSHPKDMTDDVLHIMAKYENICKNIHLPAQSGSSSVLERMHRTYTREWYLDRIKAIKSILGEECGISTDTIVGFCGETEEEHLETLSLMSAVKYDYGYMFAYSERPNTPAAKKYADDIEESIKQKRLTQIINLQSAHSLERNKQRVGKTYKVLIEGFSKRSVEHLQGRTSDNKVIVFPKGDKASGMYAHVLVTDCTAGTLIGKLV
ncbi:MAG: tRNA (N6-isopentenyl adenosine(37)-C2)-methylthiotransferase MiaB [Opitutaceae bacterium]|nr:tRNA (N6-isopentenyl adenosine(37)-C2)-methylthiotransferase MiaB [Cytophagales bacterium]